MERGKSKKAFGETLRSLKPKIVDVYIIKKFLGTFFFSLVLIMTVAVVFDFTEKVDNFMEKAAPWQAIVFDYYPNYIPYFATLYSPLFVFIAVIFFTSRMAVNTEIIAILNSGMSFRRMMWPYFLASLVIAVLIFYLTNFIIPHSNLIRLDFEDKYYRSRARHSSVDNIHRQAAKNVYVYIESFSPVYQRGRNFTIEKFDNDGKLISKLSSPTVTWDTVTHKWTALNYVIKDINDKGEILTRGTKIDTALTVEPRDFARDPSVVGTMTYKELNDYIELLRLQGSEELKLFLIEKHRRYANPFSVFILTLIGVSLSSKKIRGGIGMNVGIGLALSFSYIFFQQFSSQFSLKGGLSPLLGMWIPNLLYLMIALVLYRLAPK
ncbi:MAG TPA: LptF/LptG family permease [Bacteroidales bacterium]|nr:LptF/LptG family permease [Bacteroidales bacterium]HPI67619.1 LptF/LptG family permease [Bacteroidales bacterium]HPR72076.1 LptF/LptG family permease [Bacteroidales bacterium]